MTTNTTLTDELHRVAQSGAALNISLSPEDLIPVLLLVNQDDQFEIYGIEEPNKDKIPEIVTAQLTDRNAKAYALVLEAWATAFVDEAAKYDYRIRDMPPDDKHEVVQIIVVDKNLGYVCGSQSRIDRIDDNTRKLRDWNEGDKVHNAQGSFVITEW